MNQGRLLSRSFEGTVFQLWFQGNPPQFLQRWEVSQSLLLLTNIKSAHCYAGFDAPTAHQSIGYDAIVDVVGGCAVVCTSQVTISSLDLTIYEQEGRNQADHR